jgi:hypothetical protein
MQEEITIAFYLCDELHEAMDVHEDPQVKMNSAEVMTTALTASTQMRNTGVTFPVRDAIFMVSGFISSSPRLENLWIGSCE